MLIIILGAVGALMTFCLLICVALGVAAAHADRCSDAALGDPELTRAEPSAERDVGDETAGRPRPATAARGPARGQSPHSR